MRANSSFQKCFHCGRKKNRVVVGGRWRAGGDMFDHSWKRASRGKGLGNKGEQGGNEVTQPSGRIGLWP